MTVCMQLLILHFLSVIMNVSPHYLKVATNNFPLVQLIAESVTGNYYYPINRLVCSIYQGQRTRGAKGAIAPYFL